jgi:hypothetical protein
MRSSSVMGECLGVEVVSARTAYVESGRIEHGSVWGLDFYTASGTINSTELGDSLTPESVLVFNSSI